jgi:hypothetical protein
MEIFTQMLTGVVIFIGGLFGAGMPAVDTVEIGLSEMSPLGAEGGYAVPASGSSGCDVSLADCSGDVVLTVDSALVRWDDSVEVCWYPKNHSSCTLSPTSRFTAENSEVPGCVDVVQTAETTYTLTCAEPTGLGEKTSSKRVRVLPQMYES